MHVIFIYMWKSRLFLVAVAVFLVGTQNAISSSQDNTGTTTSTIIDALQRLQDQNQLLTNEVMDLRTKEKEASLKNVFTRTLKHGDFGNDVKVLQTILFGTSSTTAISTTGFYGGITEKKVKHFQMQTGIKGTGVFDAQTRDMFVASTQAKTSPDTVFTDSIPIDLSSIPDPQQNIQELQDQISQLSSRISDNETAVVDLRDRVTKLESELSNLQASSGTHSSSLSPITPTAQSFDISNIQISNLTKTSATITWVTNNPSTSEVDYSKNASMPIDQTLAVKSSTMVTNHSTMLSSLNSGTTYYYRITSKSSSNVIVNSGNLIFTTAH